LQNFAKKENWQNKKIKNILNQVILESFNPKMQGK
jgi:hypothetical protein